MRRLLALTALPVVLATALVGVTGAQHAMAAPLGGQGCILGIICVPSSPSPTPTPTSTSSATPTPSPSGSAAASVPALPLPSLGLPSIPAASGLPVVGKVLNPGASPTATPSPKNVAARQGLVASDSTAVLTAGTANITGFHYVGNVNMPTADGSQSMLEFTADSVDLTGTVTVTVTENGSTVTTVSSSQDFSDGVTLYATKLTGSLQTVAGVGVPGVAVPLSFTPSTIGVSLLKLPNVGELKLTNIITGAVPLTLTNVTTDQLLISGGTQVTTQLSMTQ
ncbi:MAG TPA: hypothetical protein VIZ43_06890 [Trebonia sp.]